MSASHLHRRDCHPAHHSDTPGYHDSGYEYTGSEALEEDVGERLEAGVGDEEDGQGSVVLTVGHSEIGLKTIYLRITNVGTVEEGAQVEEAELGKVRVGRRILQRQENAPMG